MKRKSLLIMLLVALFVPLAMNAQTRSLKKQVSHALRPQLQLEAAGQLEKAVNYQPGVVYHRATTNTRDNVLYSNGFETSSDLSGLSVWDYNEDDFTWGRYSGIGANGSTYALGNQSYDFDNQTAITPDDFVIMPAITLPTGGQYFAGVYAEAYYADQYGTSETMGIFVAPENDTYIYQVGSDFTISSGSYEYCEVDLTAYAGQTIEIYIRHYNCSDGTYLFIDDFSVFEKVTEEEVTIGSGTSNSTNLPTRTNQSYSFTQQIYTASEIGYTDGGNITSVSFYSAGNSTRSLDVYMVNTTMTQFSSTGANLTPTPTASDRVFSGSVSFTASAWTKITFDTPFEYTGGNVVLIVDDNTGSSSGNSARNFRVFSTGNNNYQARYIYGTTNYGINQSSFTSRMTSKNQVKFTIVPPATLVESITASDLSLTAGFSAPIDYTVLPADATNPAVTFTSANTSVATVSASGVVTGVAAGSTTITLTSVSNPEVSTTINVVVDEFVGLIFDFETDPNEEGWTFIDSDGDGFNWEWEDCSETPHNTPFEGEGCLFSASYDNDNQTALNPDNWAITPAIHILNSPSVVYLYAQGQDASYAAEHFQVYIGTSPDPTSMTAISDEFVATGSYLQYSANIPDTYAGQIVYLAIRHFNVTDMFVLDVDYLVITNAELVPDGILVESISASDVTVVVGATATITPTVLPADATNPVVSYTSADETIATVNNNGVVTGVAAGNTTITIAATDGSNVSTTINVTVTGIDVTGITADDVTVVNGETATISYTVAPANASDQSVTFTSADATIATVDAEGVVTGVAVGTTTITIASVSNPEVTATINVTVTSDPNAVQFTVNAPANAHPGDVITVEGVLAAPTSGNYAGFTALILDITYDNTAFEYNGTMTYGPVATQAQQTGAMITAGTLDNAVQLAIIAWSNNVTTEGVVFSAEFTVLAETGEYSFTAVPHEDNLSYETELLPYEATPSTVTITVPQVFTKPIQAYTADGGYYLIASPIGDVDADEVENLLENTYDFYYFDGSQELEWINYKGDQSLNYAGGFGFETGKGYLYANSTNTTLTFTGTPYSGNGEVNLVYNANSTNWAGWNLVGNPFAEDAYLPADRSFYTMQNSNVFTATSGEAIHAMEGVFVIAANDGETLTFSTTAPTNTGSKLNLNVSKDNNFMDRAIVRFGQGNGLPKIQFRKGSTKVYMPVEGNDYAVVYTEEQGEMPVSFKAEKNGTYTLSFTAEEVSFAYLHLIDNLTGNDVDLLANPSYTFDAATTDYAQRFRLVFATGDNDNFAFFSNGSFIITNDGEATLQVVDVMGRIISSETINGNANVNVNAAAGVYMLRLVNGDNVKVQKVVVR